jgi:hypothetical protein
VSKDNTRALCGGPDDADAEEEEEEEEEVTIRVSRRKLSATPTKHRNSPTRAQLSDELPPTRAVMEQSQGEAWALAHGMEIARSVDDMAGTNGLLGTLQRDVDVSWEGRLPSQSLADFMLPAPSQGASSVSSPASLHDRRSRTKSSSTSSVADSFANVAAVGGGAALRAPAPLTPTATTLIDSLAAACGVTTVQIQSVLDPLRRVRGRVYPIDVRLAVLTAVATGERQASRISATEATRLYMHYQAILLSDDATCAARTGYDHVGLHRVPKPASARKK